MKHPIMLVCAMVAAVSTSVLAEGAAAPAAPAAPAAAVNNDAAQKEKAAKLQAAREAKINKLLEEIKAKDEAQYKELIALREKDPVAFKAKMRELNKAQAPKAPAAAPKAKAAPTAAK